MTELNEVIDDEENKDPLLIFHYVGNWVPLGRLSLEDGDITEAEMFRVELIKKLEGLAQTEYIKDCIKYLNETKWDSVKSIDNFQNKYNTLREKIRK